MAFHWIVNKLKRKIFVSTYHLVMPAAI